MLVLPCRSKCDVTAAAASRRHISSSGSSQGGCVFTSVGAPTGKTGAMRMRVWCIPLGGVLPCRPNVLLCGMPTGGMFPHARDVAAGQTCCGSVSQTAGQTHRSGTVALESEHLDAGPGSPLQLLWSVLLVCGVSPGGQGDGLWQTLQGCQGMDSQEDLQKAWCCGCGGHRVTRQALESN